MADVTKEIIESYKEIIAKSLPALVGQELQALLEQAEKDKKRLVEVEQMFSKRGEELNALRTENEKLGSEAANVRTKALEQEGKAKELIERELKLELELLKKDLACANTVSDKIFRLTETVFKNNVVKTNVFGSDSLVMPGTNGCYPSQVSAPMSRSAETSVD